MLSAAARRIVPLLGPLRVTADPGAVVPPGSIVAANHTSLADPAVVLAALHRLGVQPVVMAAAGLWRVPVLGRLLTRGGHIPVRRGTAQAAASLDAAAAALADGRVILVYGEGGLPRRVDVAEAPPGAFRSGPARLALATGAPLVPLGQAGARRISSGRTAKQLAGVLTAPVRRPALHVHLGTPLTLSGDVPAATAQAHAAVTAAWRTAAGRAAPGPAPETRRTPGSAGVLRGGDGAGGARAQ
ncbi:lysophospholipid acyltransferase family protein [Streptomyces aidingensis]|uniref:1-acyl-sn-glycerol-3-phosphate acyltransferases n=1 Tax=Streptomyces aidingensis TaxID=910347 RepID=A0A1I1JG65_9ACTN|nr:lysophospholipid acyltransferase family protein [Streptomyces aidingensis]SFC44430.1 1-acyl-sn-glycerol-3-phosphate acyltransferases [Streptomyces aidingensis]